jgi:hypothetical protein
MAWPTRPAKLLSAGGVGCGNGYAQLAFAPARIPGMVGGFLLTLTLAAPGPGHFPAFFLAGFFLSAGSS